MKETLVQKETSLGEALEEGEILEKRASLVVGCKGPFEGCMKCS
jgi:hypothetical protein